MGWRAIWLISQTSSGLSSSLLYSLHVRSTALHSGYKEKTCPPPFTLIECGVNLNSTRILPPCSSTVKNGYVPSPFELKLNLRPTRWPSFSPLKIDNITLNDLPERRELQIHTAFRPALHPPRRFFVEDALYFVCHAMLSIFSSLCPYCVLVLIRLLADPILQLLSVIEAIALPP